MSSNSPHHFDHSYHETSFGGYTNRGTHVHVSEGTIHLVQANNQVNPSKPLQKLREHSSPWATFDSGERFDPPQCSPATRTEIIRRIDEWINDDQDGFGSNAVPASTFWLYGGAGVGKSAIAQSLSEKYQQNENLAATFFFFRNDGLRNNGNTLIPTLVLQLVSTFKGLGPLVEERIHANPDLFTKRYQSQIQQLLVEPLRSLSVKPIRRLISRPRLIVIDGLDECQDPEIQCNLLRAIANAIPGIPYPLRFLFTSRPEPHIVRLFNHERAVQVITADFYNLSNDPDADMDIRKFLESEFDEIRRSHCLSRYLPPYWPDRKSITLLVKRSSGHFVYAATVIRYIRSEQHWPDDRLEFILRQLQPVQEEDQPYTQLDALYSLILKGIENSDKLEKICLVLGILYVSSHSGSIARGWYSRCRTIERILGMKAGDVILLLFSPILSLVAIDYDEVRILHKSLFDFLLDRTRSGSLPLAFDPAQIHGLIAAYILREKILAESCTIFDFSSFARHCRFGYLNDTLKEYLRDLEVPYPKCIENPRFSALEMNRSINSLRLVMSHLFRALSRDDFDTTGQYHAKYAEKWMNYLRSTVPGCDQPQSSIASGFVNTQVDIHGLKERFDRMLKDWKPKDFNPATVEGMTPIRDIGIIEQEHHVWSTFARAAAFTTNSNAVSSLVFGDYFIHSYHFTTELPGDDSHFLELLTYARHENALPGHVTTMAPGGIRILLKQCRTARRALKNLCFLTFTKSMEYFLRAHYQIGFSSGCRGLVFRLTRFPLSPKNKYGPPFKNGGCILDSSLQLN